MTDDELFARHPSAARSGREPLFHGSVAAEAIDDAAANGFAVAGLDGFETQEDGRIRPSSIAEFSDLREASWPGTIERCRLAAHRHLQTFADRPALVFSVVLLREEEFPVRPSPGPDREENFFS